MRTASLLLLPLLLGFLLLCEQEPAVPPSSDTAAGKCTIEGQVVNAVTGGPLRKVTLILNKLEAREPGYSARTDAAGRFAIKELEPGQYRMWASRTGYARQEYGSRGRGPGTVLTLEPGRQLTGLVFRLYPQGVISGVVLDEEGEPVVNAEVLALQSAYWRRKRQLQHGGSAQTNDLGEFRIHGLGPGKYYLSAAAQSFAAMWGAGGAEGEQAYAPTYYPGVVNPSVASPLELAAGAELRGIQIALQRVLTVRVRGRVVNPLATGRQREAFVSLHARQSDSAVLSQVFAPVLDPKGNFEFRGVVPGAYTLVAEWHQGNLRYRGRRPLDVQADLDDVTVELSPGLELSGAVRLEGKAELDYADLSLFLNPWEQDEMGGARATVKDDGSFTFQNVPPDRYTFGVYGQPESCYLNSVRLGTEEVLESGFELSGPASTQLEVVLSAQGGRIEGDVRSETQKAVRGARVVLVPEPRRREVAHLYKSTTTDQAGKFRLAGIAPGEYKLFAWDQVEENSWEDPEFLKPFEDRGRIVRIAENGREKAQLNLIVSGELAGKAPESKPPKPQSKGVRR